MNLKLPRKLPPTDGGLFSVASLWVKPMTGTQETRILKVGALPFCSDDII